MRWKLQSTLEFPWISSVRPANRSHGMRRARETIACRRCVDEAHELSAERALTMAPAALSGEQFVLISATMPPHLAGRICGYCGSLRRNIDEEPIVTTDKCRLRTWFDYPTDDETFGSTRDKMVGVDTEHPHVDLPD